MPCLYHYTTAAGLKGIFENRSVWASDYRFLNDSQEFRHGLALFRELLNSLNHGLERINNGDIREQINETLDRVSRSDVRGHEAVSVFVASFSEAPDLLSQWRGYNKGKGYSVGFDQCWLDDSARQNGFALAPVAYDYDAQREVLIGRINLLMGMLLNRPKETEKETMQEWYKDLFMTIAFCKHHTFHKEREFRAIKVQYGWPPETKTRPSLQGLIPYVELHLNGQRDISSLHYPNNLGFEQIIVGPALDKKQLLAVDALLAPLHMRFKVTKSEIPFVTE